MCCNGMCRTKKKKMINVLVLMIKISMKSTIVLTHWPNKDWLLPTGGFGRKNFSTILLLVAKARSSFTLKQNGS